MAVTISGKLIGPNGDPRQGVTIMLTAVRTSSAVVQLAPSSSTTGEDGSYSLSVEVGTHNVMIEAYGRPFEKVGQITVYADSKPGTLNDFLTAPGESELTPAIIATVNEMRDSAKADADRAEAAAQRAEAVGDNEYTFKTVADGMAGTVAGQYFRVPGGVDDNVAFYYYLNDDGKAVQVSQLVGAAAVERAILAANKSLAQSGEIDKRTQGYGVEKKVYDTEGVLIGGGFFDAKGASPLNYTENGDVNITGAQFKNIPNHPEYDWAQTDKNNIPYIGGSKMGGAIIGRVEIVEIPGPPGVVFVDKNYIPYAADPSYDTDLDIPVIGGAATPPVTPPSPFRPYDYMGVRSEGQSLSLGAANPNDDPQPVSTEQRYGNKGFSTNNNSGMTDTDTLVPLVEKRYQPAEGTWPAAETPVTGATHKLVEMIQAETGLSFDHQASAYIGSAPGTGGQPIKNLIKGTAAYSRMIAHVTNSLRLAADEGRTFAELAVVWMQGESDYRDQTSRADYLALYLQYIADSLADKKAITGQLFDPIFISYQLSTHRAYRRRDPLVALALRDAAMLGKTEIAYPGYIGDYYASDHIHGMPETYYMFSQYTGRMIYKKRQDMLEGVTRMHRLDVIDEIRQGIFTMLYFNVPAPPLVFDTDWVAPAENMGFYIRDSVSLDVIDIITAVDIAGSDRVRITTSRPLRDSEIVTYGWGKAGDPLTNGRTTGPRGNLRDSEGDLPGESYTDGAGVLRKLHNWCVIF